jgi:hypothetical protein
MDRREQLQSKRGLEAFDKTDDPVEALVGLRVSLKV